MIVPIFTQKGTKIFLIIELLLLRLNLSSFETTEASLSKFSTKIHRKTNLTEVKFC